MIDIIINYKLNYNILQPRKEGCKTRESIGGMDLGSVKVDLYSSDLRYKIYTLADVEVVELLLRYRYKYDPYLYLQPNNNFTQAGDIEPLNSEAIVLFQDLDRLINNSGLSNEQLKIIKLVQDGYTLEQMIVILGVSNKGIISRKLKVIYKKIINKNLWDWRKVIYTTVLDLKTKQCSKCKENLPATEEFFYVKDDTEDGFHKQCKTCFR
jgi:DNA-binding CsgD family transcriptional regulator